MDNPRKRSAQSGQSPQAKVMKRARSIATTVTIDFDSLSFEQQQIIAQAAAILQVPFGELPSALGNIHKPSEVDRTSPTRHPRKIRRKMKVTSEKSKFLAPTTSSPVMDHVRGTKEEKSHVEESPSSNNCIDKFWGVGAPQWADCFASLVPFQSSANYEPNQGDVYLDTSMPYQITSADANGSFLPEQILSPHTDTLLNNDAPLIDLHDSFACDNYSSVEWISGYPALLPPMTQSLERTQPHTQVLPMTYPLNNSISPSWQHREIQNDIHNANSLSIQVHNSSTSDSQDLLEDSSWDNENSETASSVELDLPARRGPFRNLSDRAQTAQTRKLVACLRCRMQRIRCSPDPLDPRGVCLTCKKVSNPKIPRSLQCFRWKINDIRLFKPGQVPGMEWTSRWSDKLDNISQWASTNTRTIGVTEGYCVNPLMLEVAEFVPVPGDMLQRSWVASGVKKSVSIPPFALFDLDKAQEAYQNYINDRGAEFFKGALDPKNQMIWSTYSAAFDMANDLNTAEEERKLLKMVLRLWVAIRINTSSTYIVGEDTLNMPHDILDETYPMQGRIPIPPVMGAQIELLVRTMQITLRTRVLDQLQKMIMANKWSNWYTIYLCIFILLHNCAMITRHDAAYAIKHGLKNRFARPAMVNDYHQGANTLLAHWHYCNKGLKAFSSSPLSAVELIKSAGLNVKQTVFIDSTRSQVKAKNFRFEELRRQNLVEDDYFFVSQMYEEDWEPRSAI